MNTRITDTHIIILEVNDGCVSCPFAKENACGADESVTPTHTYSFPVKCPLLRHTVRVVQHDDG